MIFNVKLFTSNIAGTPEYAKAARVARAYGPMAWGKQ